MELHSSSRPRRALIVEDEITIALDLEDAMSAMGFNHCDLASSDTKARSLAMETQPDVALVDVCLQGGREGIEAARWLREVCGRLYSSPPTMTHIQSSVFMSRCPMLLSCQSRNIVRA
jgi:CheY-like chemotaxis protein